MRQYGRDDIDYETWYTPWMKLLAKTCSKESLEGKLFGNSLNAKKAGLYHLRAIEGSCSMQGNSSRRASTRNAVAALGEFGISLRGALEIYELFPEKTKEAIEGSKK